MPRHLARDVRGHIARALRHASRLARLAHRQVSGEHLMTLGMYAVSALHPGPGRPARVVLHKYGVTIEDVAAEVARRAGPGAVLFGGLDREALAAIGIDLDAVRARIEPSAGPETLAQVVRQQPRPPGLEGRPGTLVLLRRAHPDIFDDALQAVISQAKERKS